MWPCHQETSSKHQEQMTCASGEAKGQRRVKKKEKGAVCLLRDHTIAPRYWSHCSIEIHREVHMPYQRQAKVSPVNTVGATFAARFIHACLMATA